MAEREDLIEQCVLDMGRYQSIFRQGNGDLAEGLIDAGWRPACALLGNGDQRTWGEGVMIRYRNHRGEVADRRILPLRLWHGRTQWHPEDQWLMDAIDLDKGAQRSFALRDVLRFGGGR